MAAREAIQTRHRKTREAAVHAKAARLWRNYKRASRRLLDFSNEVANKDKTRYYDGSTLKQRMYADDTVLKIIKYADDKLNEPIPNGNQ